MRVIGGSARGRVLRARPPDGIRPTRDRVREAIFDVLSSLDALRGGEVLDLFAGTGALGIEALSRGADSAAFVDSNGLALQAVRKNLDSTGLADRKVRLVHEDALVFCGRAEHDYDLVFCDPPYAFSAWPELLSVLPARLVVAESGEEIGLGDRFELHRLYRYGTTLITVMLARDGRRAGPS